MWRGLVLGAAVLCEGFVLGAEQKSKVSHDAAKLNDLGWGDFVVQFSVSPDAGSLKKIVGAMGQVKAVAGLPDTYVLHLPAVVAKALENNSSVKYVTPDRTVSKTTEFALPAITATIAQSYNYTGKNIGIALVDSGINAHPDLKDGGCGQSRVVYRENFRSYRERSRR